MIPDIVFLGIPPNDTLSAFTEVAGFTRTPPKETRRQRRLPPHPGSRWHVGFV